MDTDQIRIRDDPRTAQTFNPSDQLHNSWFLFCPLVLIFCENKQINDFVFKLCSPCKFIKWRMLSFEDPVAECSSPSVK